MNPGRQQRREDHRQESPRRSNRYEQLIERIFFAGHQHGDRTVDFRREDIEAAAQELGVKLPKNLGDVVYSFRYRAELPEKIRALLAGTDEEWVILPTGRARYRFVAMPSELVRIRPNRKLPEIRVPDATPGVIAMHALSDEQALLAKVRYNRLIDLFLRIPCYSLQNHLRTTIPDIGQVETDEVYVGLDRHGAHYVVPVQAKGGKDRLGIVQIVQDFALCQHKFPDLIARPVAAQFIEADSIALFEFRLEADGRISVPEERHYRLVPSEELSSAEVTAYRQVAEAELRAE